VRKPNKPAGSAAPRKVASTSAKVTIDKFPTGVPGLDDILGGGVPEFSMSIIGGAPGGGKTTLAHQIAFANATSERPALYFTILGEPVVKMLRYQQQFSFFDESKLHTAVRFINLSDVVLEQDLNAVAGGNYQASHGGQRERRCGGFLPHIGAQGDQRCG
jgi:circadian clock protein KaiC